jgi:hypothetical protein
MDKFSFTAFTQSVADPDVKSFMHAELKPDEILVRLADYDTLKVVVQSLIEWYGFAPGPNKDAALQALFNMARNAIAMGTARAVEGDDHA